MRLGSDLFESRQEPSSPTPITRNRDLPPQVNGMTTTTSVVPTSPGIPNGSHQGDLADLEPPRSTESQVEAPPTIAAAVSQQDSEGFSVPSRDLDPISQAQQEAAALEDGSAPQYNVNIRDAPIQDEGGSADAALADMATKLVCILM